MKVRLANSIRWRHVAQPDGTTKPESNTRFVRWSDGSLQVSVPVAHTSAQSSAS
jgi:Leo1-like protein